VICRASIGSSIFELDNIGILTRVVRRRTGGRRRRWVVLWPAAAARRAFFIGGGGVGPDERTLKQRTRWTGVYSWFYGGQPLHLWCPLGCWRRKVNCEYARYAQFYSRKELIVHCLISGGAYKCNVECWGDADGAGVENAALENVGIKNMASVKSIAKLTNP